MDDKPAIKDPRASLWNAVVHQAITDATLPLPRSGNERFERVRAREWILKPNRDFEEVCGLAGIEPDSVREHAIPLIAEAAKNDAAYDQSPRKPRTGRPRRNAASSHSDVTPATQGESPASSIIEQLSDSAQHAHAPGDALVEPQNIKQQETACPTLI